MEKKKTSKSSFSEKMCSSFTEAAKLRSYRLKSPTSSQRDAHVDFVMLGLNKDGKTTSVLMDVKAWNSNSSDKWQWIEFKNANGKPGWIYQDSDFVVFERKNDFLIVNRKNLVTWVNVTPKIRHDMPIVQKPWQAKYRLYSRSDKKELITQITAQDLLDIKGTQLWKK